MIQIRKDDLQLVLGGLFLVLVILVCMFSPYMTFGEDEPEVAACDCPYCTGQLGTFNAVVLDSNNQATFVDPDSNITYRFEYVDGEGLVGGRVGEDGSIVEEFSFGHTLPAMSDEDAVHGDGEADESFGGYGGEMATVDENGNTVYVLWVNDRDGNPIE